MTENQIELVVALVMAAAGSSVLTAWVTARQVRGRTDAETESLRVKTADDIIIQLSAQLREAFARIESLEAAKEKDEAKISRLTNRVGQLEHTMAINGLEIPPPQMV